MAMRRRRFVVGSIVATAVVGAWLLVGEVAATGATSSYINIAVPAMTGVEESTHNDGNATPPDACEAQVPLDVGEEHFAGMFNGKGSFVAFLRLTDGHTISSFSLFANDNDGDTDVHAYLVRRKLTNGLVLPSGYKVLAEVHSDGAETNELRQFTDTSILTPLVNNVTFGYMIEVVNCGGSEPYSVQVVTSKV
jgi:hypothetical protein